MLLADDSVLRILSRDLCAHEKLDLPVGLRDHVLMALAFDRQAVEVAEIAHAEFAGTLCEIDHELETHIVAGGSLHCGLPFVL
jgi:hypothetical protein